jgi:hypothetical protein
MISDAGKNRKDPASGTGKITCPLCGYSFEKGQQTACASCPLHYGHCRFEKCPHCGYDIPQSSRLWDLAARIVGQLKNARKNHART